MRKYTKLDPESPEGQAILAVHFISQASPDIRQKLQKLEQGPQTPFSVLLGTAFKVFNNREVISRNRQELREEEKLKRQAQYMALAISQSLPQQGPTGIRSSSQKPPLTRYQCGQQGHTVRNCVTPPLDTPCPYCHQKGHWKRSCPSRHRVGRPMPQSSNTQGISGPGPLGQGQGQLPLSVVIDYQEQEPTCALDLGLLDADD